MCGENMKYNLIFLFIGCSAQSMHLENDHPNTQKIHAEFTQEDSEKTNPSIEMELVELLKEETINRYQSLIWRTKAWEYIEVGAKVLSDISQITSLALYMSQNDYDCESNKLFIELAGYCGVASFGLAKFAGIAKKFQADNKQKINMIFKTYAPSVEPIRISNARSEKSEEI